MFALITGGSGSGKSEYAESCAVELAGKEKLPLYYIATMIPYGEEGKRRVKRHLKQREGKGFVTVERYTGLRELVLPSRGIVLLECASNLVANEIFEPQGAGEDVFHEVLAGIDALQSQGHHLLVVTNEIFSDGITYDEMTEKYQKHLAKINAAMAAKAEWVTEVVCGIVLEVKKPLYGQG